MYRVNLGGANSIGRTLGFSGDIYKEGNHRSDKIVDIIKINSIRVLVSIIPGNDLKGEPSNCIYSFFPDVEPGYKIIQMPNFPIYLHIFAQTINDLTVRLTDQDGKLLNLRGERLGITFHVRERN